MTSVICMYLDDKKFYTIIHYVCNHSRHARIWPLNFQEQIFHFETMNKMIGESACQQGAHRIKKTAFTTYWTTVVRSTTYEVLRKEGKWLKADYQQDPHITKTHAQNSAQRRDAKYKTRTIQHPFHLSTPKKHEQQTPLLCVRRSISVSRT
jgi:hypothetical protein